MLAEVIGTEEMLLQTAEECNELAKACSKLARHMRGVNKVYNKSLDDMQFELSDEIADVRICMDELINCPEFKDWLDSAIDKRMDVKRNRMKERLEEEYGSRTE